MNPREKSVWDAAFVLAIQQAYNERMTDSRAEIFAADFANFTLTRWHKAKKT